MTVSKPQLKHCCPQLKENSMSNYMYFNPYKHLTKNYRLTDQEWEDIKARWLTEADLVNIENGGYAKVGRAARVWKA
jgi:hypothetical protein